MLDPRILKLTCIAIALHVLLLMAIQAGLARRVPSDDPTEAVIADLFAPEPAPRAAAPEPVRRPEPKPVRIARPAPAPKPAPVETPRPEPGVEAVRQAVDAAHAATSQAASAPAAPTAPGTPSPVARPAPADAGGGAPAAAASTSPRAVQFGEVQCSTPEPRYPLASRRLGEQGTVRVRLVIDESGAVEQAEVLSSSGSGPLDRVALEAARATRCRPYLADGRPIRVSAVRPFAFRIE